MSKRTAYICDICKNDMDVSDIDRTKDVINAEVYGVHMHTVCFLTLNQIELLKLLGLDDITIGGEKLIYTKDFK